METKNIQEKCSLLEEKKKRRGRRKENKYFKLNILKTKRIIIIRCQYKYSCEKKLCEAFGLKMLPICKSALNGVCGKVNHRNENGQKTCIILAACNLQTLQTADIRDKVSEIYSSSNNVDDSLNYSSDSWYIILTLLMNYQ